jgi:hypothetical protein
VEEKMTFILTLFLLLAIWSPAQAEMTRSQVIAEVQRQSKANGVDWRVPAAVMEVESGLKCGPLGKKGTFIGPGGLHKDFRAKWDIDDPVENIRLVVVAFKGKNTKAAIIRRLKTYNRTWWKARYIPAVLAKIRELRKRPSRGGMRDD